jgi:asparagine synthase (glutamine-hydrolysing)
MCGVAGRLNLRDNHSLQGVRCIRGALPILRHRGPDAHGTFIDDKATIELVHTRLAVLDLSPLGQQPMSSDDGSIALAYNGETYNYRQIRIELERTGARFFGQSDTEVILRLYEQHRPASDAELVEFFGSLNGIFALAIWDSHRQELIVARDALGVKPLYYLNSPDQFAFASELKALLPLTESVPSVDHIALNQYLSFGWAPGDRTMWDGAKRLEPGTFLRVTRSGEVTLARWYQLPAFRRHALSSSSTPELASQTADLLRRAVHRQMVADVPLGAFLSGGLDSSSVVAFARELNPALRCFTIDTGGASDPGFAEDLPYARLAARHLGVPLEVVSVTAGDLAHELEAMVWQLDEPLADPAPLHVLHICQAARKAGYKVMLSGAGGDDILTGYPRHRAVQLERYWSWLPRGIRSNLRWISTTLDVRGALGRRLRKALSGADLEGDARLIHYFSGIDREDLVALYSPALRGAIADTRAWDPMHRFLGGLPADSPALERMLALEQRFFLADHNLTYTDKMSMAVGVEVRVPFLDLDLIEFAATVPLHCKQRGRHGKWILKRAMEPFLPRELIHRPKTGFSAPLARWVRGELREWVCDMLSEDTLRRRGLFDPAAVRRLLEDNDAGRIHGAFTILSLACVEVWCRRFIDR